MIIYYARILKSDGFLFSGKFYYEYFNSKEAAYHYKDLLEKRNSDDVLEVIGEAKFNSNGMLYHDERTEIKIYNPDEDIIV